MSHQLTIKRPSAAAPITLEVTVFNPETDQGFTAEALLDTGNDHTVIREEVFAHLGLKPTGRQLSIHGVTGSSTAATSWVHLGVKFDGDHPVFINSHEVAVMAGLVTPILLGRDCLTWFNLTSTRTGQITLEVD